MALTAGVLLAAGVALAAPAAALEDPRRPTATVTHGPSCGPGVVRTLVTNGSEPHRVALVFDGAAEQDSALVGPGEQVALVSTDVAWGVTVSVSVAVTDQDGELERPLELSTYTRPSAEDCAAVTAAPSSGPTPTPAPSGASQPPASPPVTAPAPSTAVPTRPTPSSSPPRSTPPASSPSSPAGPADGDAAGRPDGGPSGGSAGSAPAASVSPGGVVTVRATGFAPGEPVAVGIAGLEEPLTTVAAAADGSVQAVVQIPRGAALGPATVRFVGGESAATAGLDLQVAARSRPATGQTGSPAVVAAGLALVGAAGTLGLVGTRRTRGRHGPTGTR